MSLFSVYYCREFGRDEYATFEDILETQSSFVDSLKEIVPNAVVLQELNCDIDSNGSTDGILLYEDDKSKTWLAIMLCDSFWEYLWHLDAVLPTPQRQRWRTQMEGLQFLLN